MRRLAWKDELSAKEMSLRVLVRIAAIMVVTILGISRIKNIRDISGSPKIHGVSPHRIPEWISSNSRIKEAKENLPSGYEFELEKTAWAIYRRRSSCVALQFPEGLLKCAPIISDMLMDILNVTTVTLGEVVYGACCLDDHKAKILGCDFIVHYGHSCLVPNHQSSLPALYIFVTIRFPIGPFLAAFNSKISSSVKSIALMGTIQFIPGLATISRNLSENGIKVVTPQAFPLSPGETLGCTSPRIPLNVTTAIFVSDGTFHLESAMLQNRHVKDFYRYDPYSRSLLRSVYPASEKVKYRHKASINAKHAKMWGIVHGTLGRQGNNRLVGRLEDLFRIKGLKFLKVPLSEITPKLFQLFPQVEAWVQIACPRLSIDWGEEYTARPLLTPFEAFLALNASEASSQKSFDYPMDFYAKRTGPWGNYWNQ